MDALAVCPICDDKFAPRKGGKPQIYCGKACRDRANYLRNGTPKARGSRSEYYKSRWQDPEYQARRKPAVRNRHLLTKYGISADDFDRILEEQGGKCKICRTDKADDSGKDWNTDHDHDTGLFRGLLCRRCNGGLGWFKDDPVVLRAAADYIEESRRRVCTTLLELPAPVASSVNMS